MKSDIPKRLFILHISMNEIEPLIWRRLLTDSSTTLFELHNYIQLIFYNWRNYHLYLFEKGGVDFGDPRLWTDEDVIDVRLEVRKSYIFEYNLGIDVPSYTPRLI